MRYLVSSLLALPLLTSCTVVEQQYYDRGYSIPAPMVEVRPVNPHRHFHANPVYRPAQAGGVYHGHPDAYANKVLISPRPRPAQIGVQNNVHGHAETIGTVHGHAGNSGTVHGHAGSAGTTHGHTPTDNRAALQHSQNHGVSNQAKVNPSGTINRGNAQVHNKNQDVHTKSHGHR
ncbi:hypothetical protein ELY21_01855 [Legionella sp. km535]|uniref:hypothetical protein n=1 Tax=Legionella sp. km535 TaxID=2498107 RepID=UPI000F8C8CE1|nr:hypothetical protein [Legionella sp. km535]RUR20286.1 hypothetical protein ELY21_01855 [Legionella sp. km535]